MLQATSTEVRDGVLVVLVREQGGWFQRGQVAKLTVQAPTLDSVQISGAGDFKLRDVSGESLALVVQGAAVSRRTAPPPAADGPASTAPATPT